MLNDQLLVADTFLINFNTKYKDTLFHCLKIYK